MTFINKINENKEQLIKAAREVMDMLDKRSGTTFECAIAMGHSQLQIGQLNVIVSQNDHIINLLEQIRDNTKK